MRTTDLNIITDLLTVEPLLAPILDEDSYYDNQTVYVFHGKVGESVIICDTDKVHFGGTLPKEQDLQSKVVGISTNLNYTTIKVDYTDEDGDFMDYVDLLYYHGVGIVKG